MQRWGAFAKHLPLKRKGGVILQRWGQNAKKRWGGNANVKFYNKDKLMGVAKDRGYVTIRAIADGLAPIFGKKPNTIKANLSSGNLSKEECEVIGSFFGMTMKEYYDVFMNGLFREDMNGHYVCHVDQPYAHLHPDSTKIHTHRNTGSAGIIDIQKKKTAQDILKQLEDL